MSEMFVFIYYAVAFYLICHCIRLSSRYPSFAARPCRLHIVSRNKGAKTKKCEIKLLSELIPFLLHWRFIWLLFDDGLKNVAIVCVPRIWFWLLLWLIFTAFRFAFWHFFLIFVAFLHRHYCYRETSRKKRVTCENYEMQNIIQSASHKEWAMQQREQWE